MVRRRVPGLVVVGTRSGGVLPLAVLIVLGVVRSLPLAAQSDVPVARFVDAAEEGAGGEQALREIDAGWKASYANLVIELARFMRPPRPPRPADIAASASGSAGHAGPAAVPGDAGSPVRRRLLRFLERRTGQRFGDDLTRWRTWLWRQPYAPHPEYPGLKRAMYGRIDPRMAAFFPDDVRSLIRLDEIDWGGVRVNGIPPLRFPKHVAAADASFMADSNVVFGLFIGGEARAYPKRILAWHELALDRVGSVELAIVYCTLCGTVIPYESRVNERPFTFGTSGLLYQSNKLMFDEDTRSLWSSLTGEPVVGPLAGSGLSLRIRPVVTTTWKAWRTSHPETTVVSLDTGYDRDYSEGAAYRDYFASPNLMFEVSRHDSRLGAKDEVLALRLPIAAGRTQAVAVDARMLQRHPVLPVKVGEHSYLIVSDGTGANRVYQLGPGQEVPEQRLPARIVDRKGRPVVVTEEALLFGSGGAERAPRVSAHRAFWFGWYAQFPDTLLLK